MLARISFLAGAVICISTCIYAQKIDSLRHAYRKRGVDTTAALLAAEYAYQLYSIHPDSSLMLAKEAEALSLKLNFKKGEGRAKRVIGIYYWVKGDFEKAMQYFESALELSEKVNDQKGIGACLSNMGVVYRNKGDIGRASDFFFRSLKIKEAINDKQGIATTSNNLVLFTLPNKCMIKLWRILIIRSR